MTATAHESPIRRRKPLELASAHKTHPLRARDGNANDAPVVAAVEPRSARATAETAAELARVLAAPLVFVSVRPRPPALLGRPHYGRRLTRSLFRSRKALDAALAAASRAGVPSSGEILEGHAASRIIEFANARGARLLVVGSRRRRLRRSVSRRVIGASTQPVVVAPDSSTRATPTPEP